ncbi:DUF2663 family protein [Halalkalibacter alkalisediminis]|uniref:DUF2663 family protein n=1 Tax=Halalkalibacter alkalisediminis TaxID=935616 RepID=A0ABV6NGE7_9BACI|nr:DUF2663 family protein [Halalkalibacter alkalisediminis]
MKPFKEWNVKSNYGPEVVKVMLEEIVVRKNKVDQMEKAKIRWSLYLMFCAAIFCLFGYRAFQFQQSQLSSNVLSALIGQPIVLMLMLLLAIGFFQLHFFGKKEKKAEKEFDELREEIIARSLEFWEADVNWKSREAVYSYMKEEHDINLYHK